MKRLVSERKSESIDLELFALVCFLIFLFIIVSPVNAYYGLLGSGYYGGGAYGGLGLYGLGGLYGMGLYGTGNYLGGLYGGLYGLGLYSGSFGTTSLSNYLYGGLLAGTYGGLYGLGGMYGLGGLYGLGGMCGLGGLYGLGGIYGLGGLYGPGGMYGGLYGLGGLLGTMGLLSNPGLLNTPTQQTVQPTPVVIAEQAGTWSGTWTSLVTLKSGLMDMSLVEDPLTGILSGQVTLLLNKFTGSIPADVTGYLTTVGPGSLGITGVSGAVATFILSGGNQSFFSNLLLFPSVTGIIPIYTIDLVCIMTSPVTMIGTYEVQDIYKLAVDSGEFNLTLTAPVI